MKPLHWLKKLPVHICPLFVTLQKSTGPNKSAIYIFFRMLQDNFVPAGFRVKEDGEETAPISKHREWLGWILESATEMSLRGMKEDFKSPPINGKGPDHISKHILIEDKNWGSYFRNPSLFEREVVSRFKDVIYSRDYKWVLVISKLEPTSDRVRRIIERNDILVIELGYQLTSGSKRYVKKAVKVLKIKLRVALSERERRKRQSDYLNKLCKIPKIPSMISDSSLYYYNFTYYPSTGPPPDFSDLSVN